MLADRVRMTTFKDSLFIPEGYVLATDDDFSGTSNGWFRYIGSDLKIVIPNKIKGIAVTSYSHMFNSDAGKLVEGVVSNNTNITDMSNMFYRSSATTGYARTQADADRFNNSSGKPSALVFVVK